MHNIYDDLWRKCLNNTDNMIRRHAHTFHCWKRQLQGEEVECYFYYWRFIFVRLFLWFISLFWIGHNGGNSNVDRTSCQTFTHIQFGNTFYLSIVLWEDFSLSVCVCRGSPVWFWLDTLWTELVLRAAIVEKRNQMLYLCRGAISDILAHARARCNLMSQECAALWQPWCMPTHLPPSQSFLSPCLPFPSPHLPTPNGEVYPSCIFLCEIKCHSGSVYVFGVCFNSCLTRESPQVSQSDSRG